MAARRALAQPLLRQLAHRSGAPAAAAAARSGSASPVPPCLPVSRPALPLPATQPRLPGFRTATSPASVFATHMASAGGLIPRTGNWGPASGTRSLSQTVARASASASASASSGASGPALVELRTYTARPDTLKKYLQITADAAPLRKQLCPGWMGFWTAETGGNLGEVKHLYRYEGWEEREAARAAMQANKDWASDYLPQIRPLLLSQHSMIFVEAQDCLEAIAQAAREHYPDPAGVQTGTPVFEWRRYELVPGYHSMPTLKKHMLQGLPSRVAAQKCGKCVFMGHSEVGLLNVFVELWRYDSTSQCTQARRAARTSKEWQGSIAGIAEVTQNFTSQYLRATSFSPSQ